VTHRADLIKYIHVLKRDLGLDEDTYRSVLYNVAGGTSCSHLDEENLNLVYLAFKKMRDNQEVNSPAQKNPDQHRMIARLGYILKWDWNDIAHFCQREVKKQSTKTCNPAELSKVIRGMIGVIDYRVKCGVLMMNHTECFDYERHVKRHRAGNPTQCNRKETL